MAEGGSKTTTVSSGSDEAFDFYCEVCYEDDVTLEAKGFCVTCGEYLCGPCYTSHKKPRQMRHHEVLDKDSMPKDTPLSNGRLRKSISTLCPHHSGKSVEFYCKTHSCFGCSTCFLKTHKSCEEIEIIDEKSSNILESIEYAESIETLRHVINKSRDLISKAGKNLTLSKTSYSEMHAEVYRFRNELVENLDKCVKNIISEAKQLLFKEEQKIKQLLQKSEVIQKKTEEMLTGLEQLHSTKRVCQLYISLKERKQQIQAFKDDVLKAEVSLAETTIQFEPNIKLNDSMKDDRVLGKVKLHIQQITPSTKADQVQSHKKDTEKDNWLEVLDERPQPTFSWSSISGLPLHMSGIHDEAVSDERPQPTFSWSSISGLPFHMSGIHDEAVSDERPQPTLSWSSISGLPLHMSGIHDEADAACIEGEKGSPRTRKETVSYVRPLNTSSYEISNSKC